MLSLLKLTFALTLLMFVAWYLSAKLLPEEILRGYFSRVFEINPLSSGRLTFLGAFLSNFIIGFLGVQFMNLYKVNNVPGGLYILAIFYATYGVLLGTNSFIFAQDDVAFRISVLWERTGFNELFAYTVGYEATRGWALWEQKGLWRTSRLPNVKWDPRREDLVYWLIGLLLLVLAVMRETS